MKECSDMNQDFSDRMRDIIKECLAPYEDKVDLGEALSGLAGVLFGGYVLTLSRIKNEVDHDLCAEMQKAAINVLQGSDMRTGMTRQ